MRYSQEPLNTTDHTTNYCATCWLLMQNEKHRECPHRRPPDNFFGEGLAFPKVSLQSPVFADLAYPRLWCTSRYTPLALVPYTAQVKEREPAVKQVKNKCKLKNGVQRTTVV